MCYNDTRQEVKTLKKEIEFTAKQVFQKEDEIMNAVKIGMTIEEAAECTGIGRNTMRKLVDWGKLPVLKVGRKTIIRRDTLERFMTVNQGRNLLNQNDVRRVD